MHLVSPPFHAKGKVSTMQETLYDLVEQVQSGQNDADLILYERFRYLLERYFRKLRNNEDAKQDLIVAFLELIPHIPLSDKCCSDEQIAAYIKVSIHHAFIKISKQQAERSEKEFVFDFNEDEILEDDIFGLKMVDYLKKALIYGHTSRSSSWIYYQFTTFEGNSLDMPPGTLQAQTPAHSIEKE